MLLLTSITYLITVFVVFLVVSTIYLITVFLVAELCLSFGIGLWPTSLETLLTREKCCSISCFRWFCRKETETTGNCYSCYLLPHNSLSLRLCKHSRVPNAEHMSDSEIFLQQFVNVNAANFDIRECNIVCVCTMLWMGIIWSRKKQAST